MFQTAESHKNKAEEIVKNMAQMGANYDVDVMISAVAIVEWAKENGEFKSNSGRNYMNVSATDIYGKSEEDAVAFIVKKVAKKKKGAGAQALKEKYGSASARRIISKNANI